MSQIEDIILKIREKKPFIAERYTEELKIIKRLLLKWEI